MATSPTQIRIDSTVKEDANALFSRLGLDMSSAVNMFLRQCVLRGGLPFTVELPKYNQETLDAMEEARKISKDPNVPSYSSVKDLFKALDEE
ncbi:MULTISPECIES: type II toxin-antitoxin system RelB/DinJ family antitoxin [unclassified Gemella]|uniref:type II toxin-antitoxin system RelB/DinJ family antitoxin n=1 Tax=unclassified Gemella TaxID=2624949 RepID=UPI001C049487|nr:MULTISPECIES: type II toxin-antitoxin system RelB/DinJ family antitoxin [unclassified Gemella]MBU0278723.1 type II toxin-antitoxin system RelB/DinJ family antitoxin [Gemella sp. zg-1178]QWQ38666.1 type II toxin-antitoxin system RelB/DinJ family antitoxin [Gemella sp. zg-570]